MKLVEEETTQYSEKQHDVQQKQKANQKAFLKPFKLFQSSIILSIQIHFLRFLFVTAIYFYSDVFLTNHKNTSQPWNSLLYFLAIMIEIIKFIGDCSLRNLLKTQEQKLCQIHDLKQKTQNGNQLPQNMALKAAKYEDYMQIFSIVRILKYQHRNYSSAFSISKYMHLIATFLVFGWMSLAQQYKEETNWTQLVVLEIFLYSIYLTSFEMDLYLIQTSQGRCSEQNKYNVSNLSTNQCKIVMRNFKKWRKKYTIIQSLGTLLVMLGVIIKFEFSLLFCSAAVMIIVNLIGLKIESIIENSSKKILTTMKRNEINTYSLLQKSTSHFSKMFKFFITYVIFNFRFQRLSYIFLWFAFARDQSLGLQIFCLICSALIYLGLGIFLLILSQIEKFSDGNRLKLMSIIEDSYQNNTDSESESQTDKNLQCAICLKYFQKGDSVNLLPCSKDHIFHINCFQDWKKIKTQCPLCRYPLSEYI